MPHPPKIIIVGPGYPFRNGPSVYLSYLCRQLSTEFQVELVNYTLLYPKFLFPGSSQFDNSKDNKAVFPNKRMLSSLNPFTWWKTAKYIQKQKPDLIAIDWWHPFFGPCNRFLTSFLSKTERKKVIFITENVISHEANFMDKALTRFGLKNACGFLALSESVENHLKSLFNKKIFRSTLPIFDLYKKGHELSTTEAKESFGIKTDEIMFLFFGIIRKYKGLDLLIEAFAELTKQHKKIRLLVAGDFYDSPEPYFDLLEKYHLEKVVIMENRYIPNEEVARYVQASDAVVLPYRSATQSGILNMAFAFLKPVIVTRVGELGALVQEGKTGVVVDTPTAESIKNGLEEYVKMKAGSIPFEKNITEYLNEKDEFKKVTKVFWQICQSFQQKGKNI